MKKIFFVLGLLYTTCGLAYQPILIKCDGLNVNLKLNISPNPDMESSTMEFGTTNEDSTSYNVTTVSTALGVDYTITIPSSNGSTYFLTLRTPSINIFYSEESLSFRAKLYRYMKSPSPAETIHGEINTIDSETTVRCLSWATSSAQ